MPESSIEPKLSPKRLILDENKMLESRCKEDHWSKKASKYFEVPRTTLQRYVREASTSNKDIVSKKLGRKPVLFPRIEDELD